MIVLCPLLSFDVGHAMRNLVIVVFIKMATDLIITFKYQALKSLRKRHYILQVRKRL